LPFDLILVAATHENMDSDFWIKKLNLSQHPAGGFFGDIYRSNEKCTELPERYGENAERSSCSIIYSLLKVSALLMFPFQAVRQQGE